jgi:hypothetical protein
MPVLIDVDHRADALVGRSAKGGTRTGDLLDISSERLVY